MSERRSPSEHVDELKELVVGYARQETVDPLRNLGRYLGFGIGGAVLVGLGCISLLYALLRGLQSIDALNDPTTVDTGWLTLVPYAATILAGLVMIGIAVSVIARGDDRKDR